MAPDIFVSVSADSPCSMDDDEVTIIGPVHSAVETITCNVKVDVDERPLFPDHNNRACLNDKPANMRSTTSKANNKY